MKIELRASAFVVFAAISLAASAKLGWPAGFSAALGIMLSVFAHEFAHAAIAQRYGIRVKAIGISARGGYTIREAGDRMRPEVLTILAGPLVNLLLFFAFFLVADRANRYLAWSNLVLALSNLAPIGPTDGFRLVRLISSVL